MLVRIVLAGVCAVGALSCAKGGPAGPGSSALRVLFIGNSLTYTNNLPVMVEALARESGISIETAAATESGFALEDHWSVGTARSQVRNGNFDVVIMQQGPSSLPDSRVFLREWTATWAGEIRARGGEPGLYAVWPEKERMYAFDDVNESYLLAAQDVNGYFFPAGDTWIETWARDPEALLYGSDDFHPSSAGTYAAAVVIVATLASRDPETLAPTTSLPGVFGGELSMDLAATIRAAAKTVMDRYGGPVRPH